MIRLYMWRGLRFGVMPREGKAQQVFVQAKRLPQSRDAAGSEGEHDQRIKPVTLLLDGVRQPALAPPIHPRDASAVLGDSLADTIQGGAQPFFIEVCAQDGDDLVGAHSAGSLPLD